MSNTPILARSRQSRLVPPSTCVKSISVLYFWFSLHKIVLLSKIGFIAARERCPIAREPIARTKSGTSVAIGPIPSTAHASAVQPLSTISDGCRPFARDGPDVRVRK